MTETVYTIRYGGNVYETSSADMAEVYSYSGADVTAETRGEP